jgi:8-oxo-dGTP pyrophosphatase MutT (NUDIX family)
MTHPAATDQSTTLPLLALGAMTLLVAAVIVHDLNNDQVVLLRRGPHAKFAQGMWDLPVGKALPGEPITITAVRELREETGLTVDPETLEVAHTLHAARGVEAPNGFLTNYLTQGPNLTLYGWRD